MSDNKKPALVRRGEERWEIEIDVKAVADAIGVDVLGNFYRLFVAVDRIVSLEHFLVLNHTQVEEDSPAQDRNRHHLFLLLVGAMYETGNALQGLTSTKFGAKLPSFGTWAALDEMRVKFNKEPFAAKIRNGFAYHLGEPAAYQAAIEHGPPIAILEVGKGSLMFDSRFVEPWDALFRYEQITDDQMDAFVKRTRDAHMALPDLVLQLFFEVLVGHGLVEAPK